MKRALILAIAVLLSVASTYGPRGRNGSQAMKGRYLGRSAPGMKAERFIPDALKANDAWFWHGSPAFSPDQDEVFFVRFVKDRKTIELCRMTKKDDLWEAPQKAAFSRAGAGDNNPFFLDAKTLLFYSTRFGGSLCRVEKTGAGWSEPAAVPLAVPAGKRLGSQFSVSKSGAVYGELWNEDDSDADVYRWPAADGRYPVFEKLAGEVLSPSYDFMPFVDPEERYLLFCSQRPGGAGKTDIYVSFRNADGTWTEAVNLGPDINTEVEEGFPWISPDGRSILFCREGASGFNPFWVDSRIIDRFKPKKAQ